MLSLSSIFDGEQSYQQNFIYGLFSVAEREKYHLLTAQREEQELEKLKL